MSTARERSGAFDLDLALVLGFVVALNLPLLASRVVPIHDTFYNFANFQIFYSELFLHGDLASWFPYGSFGLQSDYEQLISLGPFTYLAGLVGALLRVPDALLLFKLSVVGELIAFAYGVYLLARRLFATRATALILGLSAAGTTIWYAQQWWDLRIYYLLPLVLYFGVGFLEERRPERLWLAGLTGVAWAVGNLPYLIPLWILVLLLVGGVAARGYRSLVTSLLTPSRTNLGTFALFAAAAAVYAWLLLHALDHASLDVANRDPLTGTVDLENFRSYGGNANLVIVANSLLFGWPLHLPWGSKADNSVYIGLLPLLGLGLALARERDRFFLGLMTAAVVLVALSLGGAFATIAWYVPGLSFYRHVGLVYGVVKVLLLLASGYGIERIWSWQPARLSHPLLLLVGAAFLLEAMASLPRIWADGAVRWVQLQWGSHVLVRLAAYAALLALCRVSSWSLRTALALALVLDLSLYQLAVYQIEVPKLADADRALLDAVQARDLPYQVERREQPLDRADPRGRTREDERSQHAIDLASRFQEPRYVYGYVYPFARFDPCRGTYRNDTASLGVRRLLALERSEGVDLREILACHAPKLRLASAAVVVPSADQARRELVAALRAGARRPAVIEVGAGAPPPTSSEGTSSASEGAGSAAGAGTASETPGSVVVTRFTPSELEAQVQVDAQGGAWLLYADAYHPGWRATVNGRETPVFQADLAFKALRVPPGASAVRLWFDQGGRGVLRYAIGAFGAAWALGLLVAAGASLLRGSHRAA